MLCWICEQQTMDGAFIGNRPICPSCEKHITSLTVEAPDYARVCRQVRSMIAAVRALEYHPN